MRAGKYSVPVLWDKKEKTIVNNESSEILRMFNSAFNDLCKKPDLDLYPEELRDSIEEVNSWVYPGGVGLARMGGFVQSGWHLAQAAVGLVMLCWGSDLLEGSPPGLGPAHRSGSGTWLECRMRS